MDDEVQGQGVRGDEEPLSRGMALLLLSQGVFLASGYAIHVFLARRLGPLDYGVFSFVITVLTWVEILVYGTSNLAVRHIQGGLCDLQSLKASLFRAQCALSLIIFLALSLVGLAIGLSSRKYGFLFSIAFLDMIFVGFYQLYLGYLNGFRQYTRQAIASVTYSLSKASAMVSLVLFGWGVKGALLGNVFSSVAGLLAGSLLFASWSNADPAIGLACVYSSRENLSIGKLIKGSLTFALVPLLVNFVMNLDLWVVNFLRGGPDVGYYSSAGTISRIVYFLFSAVSMAFFPAMVSSLHDGTASAKGKRLFDLSVDFFAAVALPFSLALAVNGWQLVTLLYGEAYASAGFTTSILGMGMLFLTIFVYLVHVLYAAGEYRKAVRMLVMVALSDIVLAPPLVLVGGRNGAALSTTTVSLVGLMMAYRLVKKDLSLEWDAKRMGKAFPLCIACFMPLLAIPREGMTFIPLSLLASLVYLLASLRLELMERSICRRMLKSILTW